MSRAKEVFRRELIYHDIEGERLRQNELKAAGRFKYTAADPEMKDGDRIMALGEEFGEVCNAALNANGLATDFDNTHHMAKHKLRKELVQVAAVATAWLEALDVELA